MFTLENLMREPRPRKPPGRVGVCLALAAFSYIAWWTLWGEGVEHVAVPSAFMWPFTASIAGICVARWLARFSALRLAPQPGTPARSDGGWPAGNAVEIGGMLLVPGTSCWFAMRAAYASVTTGAYQSRLGRCGRAALWMVWALAGTTGQAVPIFFIFYSQSADTSLTSDVVLSAAGVVNALSIALLVLLEPRVGPRAGRRAHLSPSR